MSQSLLNRHFREFIELLEKRKIKYLLVGGYAVGFHGFPRYTGDLGIFVAVESKNAEALLAVFRDFGFEDLGLTDKDFLEPDMVVEIGREPLKIQILTGVDGIQFEEAFLNRVFLEDDGLSIPIISYEDLLKSKEASGRGRDKIDLEELKKIRGESGGPRNR